MQLKSAVGAPRSENRYCGKLHECCNQVFRNTRTFENHMRWHNVPEIKCDFCGTTFSNDEHSSVKQFRERMRYHMRTCNKVKRTQPSIITQTSEADTRTVSSKRYKRHPSTQDTIDSDNDLGLPPSNRYSARQLKVLAKQKIGV